MNIKEKAAITIFVVLMTLKLFDTITVNNKQKEIDRLVTENFTLNAKLKSQVQISNGKTRILYRDKEKIVYKTRHRPYSL